MPKKTIKKLLPDHQKIKANKHLQIFGDLIHNGNLWHLNRRSVAKAFAVGLFCAFIPIPFQMVLAAGLAIIVHANLPLSIALVWITNPVTMPAIFYFCYVVGTWILGKQEQAFAFVPSWQWVVDSVSTIGPSFLLGCAVLATLFSLIGYFGIHGLWRYSVNKAWKKRMKR
ncbi:DUF2062 domain-containing protein [Thalassotalea sp. 1_MG-2023]|uniref:DUF2062 domain-containing protein n=1 Tax=Thalassotalea sp. 1_MG-2023 TaxID=3062680 RepID=UPI0026E31351|nr:DUF2062 domain-containing protein [Thalassotalea sp. 1_MG-2023]MDO6427890.1 DUF2062 domain-containing protein [Thalassotalea sp. 1_MG-2023]